MVIFRPVSPAWQPDKTTTKPRPVGTPTPYGLNLDGALFMKKLFRL